MVKKIVKTVKISPKELLNQIKQWTPYIGMLAFVIAAWFKMTDKINEGYAQGILNELEISLVKKKIEILSLQCNLVQENQTRICKKLEIDPYIGPKDNIEELQESAKAIEDLINELKYTNRGITDKSKIDLTLLDKKIREEIKNIISYE